MAEARKQRSKKKKEEPASPANLFFEEVRTAAIAAATKHGAGTHAHLIADVAEQFCRIATGSVSKILDYPKRMPFTIAEFRIMLGAAIMASGKKIKKGQDSIDWSKITPDDMIPLMITQFFNLNDWLESVLDHVPMKENHGTERHKSE